jgi:hypothetical protein
MRKSVIVISLAALLLGSLAAPGVARPGEVHSTANAFMVEVIDPGESRITGNVWHLRGFTLLYRVEGVENPQYATGWNQSVVNWNWNLKTGGVTSWGTYDYTLDAFTGGFSGTFTIEISPRDGVPAPPDFDPDDPTTWICVGWSRGEAVGHGYGDLEGAQTRAGTWSDSCGAFVTYDTTVFFPGQ